MQRSNGPRYLTIVSLSLGAICQPLSAAAQSKPEPQHFDPKAVVSGIEIDRPQCDALASTHTAIWVEAAGRTACIRYYAAGLRTAPASNPIVAIWLNGDVLGPSGKNADRRQSGFGPEEVVRHQAQLSDRFGVPAIHLGRPGTYGSAGKHFDMRGRPIEAALIDAALDGLKQRYRIQSLALGGHSGGGTLVAEMLSRRADLRCAVLSSGASAYRAYLQARGLLKPGQPLPRFDPIASIDKVATAPDRRVFVIGDPRETNVPFPTQKLYFDALAARGHAAWLVPLRKATDPRHHNLVDHGETANAMCAAGATTDAILSTLNAMPDQRARLTN